MLILNTLHGVIKTEEHNLKSENNPIYYLQGSLPFLCVLFKEVPPHTEILLVLLFWVGICSDLAHYTKSCIFSNIFMFMQLGTKSGEYGRWEARRIFSQSKMSG